MDISINSGTRGGVRTMTVLLRGDDRDFVNLIDEGFDAPGTLGILIAKIAAASGLVAERSDANSDAARLLRRAADLLDRADAPKEAT